jgi:hypothetical protein
VSAVVPDIDAIRRLRPIPVLAIFFCLFTVNPSAGADYEPLGSGSTRLTLDKGFVAALKQNGVRLTATAPARLGGRAITFPVVGGKFDPTGSRGTIEHAGALVFEAGGRRIPLKALQLKTTQRGSPLSARVGGSQLKLAAAKRLMVSRSGFGGRVTIARLTLSSKLATRLGKKLRLKTLFEQGMPLGQSLTRANPETISVLGRGRAELALDPGFAAKLDSLFVAVNPIFPAEHPGAVFTLPIFGGMVAPDGSQGTVETSGALEFLQLGGGQVFWQDGWIDLGAGSLSPELNVQPSPPYAGKVGRTQVAGLGIGVVSADPGRRAVAVSGSTLSLSGSTAQTFNEVFARPQGKDNIFAAGEAFGTLSFAVQGQ